MFMQIYLFILFRYNASISGQTRDTLIMYSFLNLSDPHFKGAVQLVHEGLQFQMMASNGTVLNRFLNPKLHVHMLCFSFFNDFLVELFDEKIQQLLQGGIIDYLDRGNKENCETKRYKHLNYDEPKVLTMEHLKAGFVVWLVAVLLATFAFIGEWINRLLENYVVKCIFDSYYELKYIVEVKLSWNIINRQQLINLK